MDNVGIVEDVQVQGIQESGNNKPEDHCLGTKTINTNDVALGETIFCRQIDTGKYLDQVNEEAATDINEGTTASTDAAEEVELPKAKGSYVLGKIQGMGCVMTVDTACTQTIVLKQMYY